LVDADRGGRRGTSKRPASAASSPADPFASGKIVGVPPIVRADLEARIVGVLDGVRRDRGLALIAPPTRCVRRYDIHELIVTDEQEAGPRRTVDRCYYVAFVEFRSGGVLVTGDTVSLRGAPLGVLAGFDESHSPNHLNVVLKAPVGVTGVALGARPGDPVVFRPVPADRFVSPSSEASP
jgi:hypothetical protein